MKTAKRLAALTLVTGLTATMLVPTTDTPPAQAADPVEDVVITIKPDIKLPLIDQTVPPHNLPKVWIVDGSGSPATRTQLEVVWENGAYKATESPTDPVASFDPESSYWSYDVIGLVGYQNVTGGSLASYDQTTGLTITTSTLDLNNEIEYTLNGDATWAISYSGCGGICSFGTQTTTVPPQVTITIPWSTDFPVPTFAATAPAGYVKSFTVGGAPKSLASDPSVSTHSWTDDPAYPNSYPLSLVATTALPQPAQTAKILDPAGNASDGLKIAGFNPTACGAAPVSGGTTTYYCDDTWTPDSPAVTPYASGDTLAKSDTLPTSALDYGVGIDVDLDNSVKGTYFVQNIASDVRTITKWTLTEDFTIVTAPDFQVVEFGDYDTDAGNYELDYQKTNSLQGGCLKPGASGGPMLRCWFEPNATIDLTITPDNANDYYLQSFEWGGNAQVIPAPNPATGAHVFSLTIPAAGSVGNAVNVDTFDTASAEFLGTTVVGDLRIPGFKPNDDAVCDELPNSTDTYLCKASSFGSGLAAIESKDAASGTEISKTLNGTYEPSIPVPPVESEYFTQAVVLDSNYDVIGRTIKKWTLAETFTILVDDYQWVNIGDASDDSYTVSDPVFTSNPTTSFCKTDDAGFKVRCLLPEKDASSQPTNVSFKITPVVTDTEKNYLESVKAEELKVLANTATETWADFSFIDSNGGLEFSLAVPAGDPTDPAVDTTYFVTTATPAPQTARITTSPAAGLEIPDFQPTGEAYCAKDPDSNIYWCTEDGFSGADPVIQPADGGTGISRTLVGAYPP
ncbi:MAG: hypothetical protein LBG60_04155, partial [Bifidobacteriaceae bacterium]|nr:hypothetical protein [Bifidobacteriaceae bacterium]